MQPHSLKMKLYSRSTSRPLFTLQSSLLAVLSLFLTLVPTQHINAVTPNIIIIFTDDQGYNDLGCYGSPDIETPHIDAMAREGIMLTNYYAQPICGPSRAALMTGSYPLRIAEVGNVKRPHPMVHPKEILIPQLLKQVNYTTGCIGKWDLNGHSSRFQRPDIYPDNFGFDYWFGTPSSNDSGTVDLWRNRKVVERKVGMNQIVQKYHQEAIKFIETNKESPFFLYLAHTMPHTKLGASENFRGKSKRGLYGDVIQEIDWSTGQILNTLKKHKLQDNTLVIFTSDNGPWLVRGQDGGSASPLRAGKTTTWEGGVRVPCVVWAPGKIPANQVSSEITSTLDILPTVCELVKVEQPNDRVIDGQSLLPLLTGKLSKFAAEREFYYYFQTHLQAVRKGKWKLILTRPRAPKWLGPLAKASQWKLHDIEEVKQPQLYNLEADAGESNDLSQIKPQIVSELLLLADHARKDIGDYDCIGKNARFFEKSPKRPSMQQWISPISK